MGRFIERNIDERAGGPAVGGGGQVEVTEKSGVELVHIPGGEFLMGSPPDEDGRSDNEGPQHLVKVSPFWLGRYPVTNEQFSLFLKENPDARPPEYWGDRTLNEPRQPVVGVCWEEARAFAEWAGGRLPTEAEWELACRAGTTGARYEEDLDAIAWYAVNTAGGTQPVGTKKPNAWGLYDLLGNVDEWCGDWFARYGDGLACDPRGPESGSRRVARGGSWFSEPEFVRAAHRNRLWTPGNRNNGVGFRMARGEMPTACAV